MAGEQPRRTFLAKVTVAGSAAVLGGAAAATAGERSERGGRRVVGGSPNPAFSRAVIFDRLVYVSGVVGTKPGTGEPVGTTFALQCRQAMENLKASVEAAGSRMADILKCTCFLSEAADFATFNTIYTGYFPSGPPARSTVVVKELVVPGAKLEIDCVACLA